jgi:hypothetical protein
MRATMKERSTNENQSVWKVQTLASTGSDNKLQIGNRVHRQLISAASAHLHE